jgi:putative flippase GtrA
MIKELLKRPVVRQFIRFALVGLESTIFTYLIFIILLHFLGFNYLFAFLAGWIGGIFFGFTFNKFFTFESGRKAYKEIWQYFLIYAFSLGVGTLIIRFLVENFALDPLIANLPAIAVTTIINFFGTKVLAFRNKKW